MAVEWPPGASALPGTNLDFNGDGFSDLAVGAPLEDVGDMADAGIVHVVYGSVSGLQGDLPDDQVWAQGSAGLGDAAEGGDRFGAALAAGDFNADGFADLAVGAPFEDMGTVADAGAVYVLYGSSGGLQAAGPDDQSWTQGGDGTGGDPEIGDRFGAALAAGDYNADGFADLAVSAPYEDLGSDADAGVVQVLYGSTSGLQAAGPDDQSWTQDSPSVRDNTEPADRFGFSLSAGDHDGDGSDDLAVGVPFENEGRLADAGAVQVLYGSGSGLQATAPDDQRWFQGREDLEDSSETRDQFGYAVAAGDVNGDGFGELVMGEPWEDVSDPRVSNAGAVNVVFGSVDGLQADAPPDELWHQDVAGVIGLAESPDKLGFSVALGDMDGDGFADLAAGVPTEDGGPESLPISGAINFLYGSADGITTAADWHLDQDGVDVADMAEEGDQFGTAVTFGDFNGDGFEDMAVAVPFEDTPEGILDAGGVHVFYGTIGGLQTTDPDDALLAQGAAGLGEAPESDDLFGSALAASG
jgi:hypothetical protein